MPFLDDLDVRIIPNGKYVLLHHFRYKVGTGTITVPKGFTTDFASIPAPFRPFISGHDKTRKPAVIHDYLYRDNLITKKQADDVFLYALREAGVGSIKRQLMYAAVRVFG